MRLLLRHCFFHKIFSFFLKVQRLEAVLLVNGAFGSKLQTCWIYLRQMNLVPMYASLKVPLSIGGHRRQFMKTRPKLSRLGMGAGILPFPHKASCWLEYPFTPFSIFCRCVDSISLVFGHSCCQYLLGHSIHPLLFCCFSRYEILTADVLASYQFLLKF